MIPVIKSIMDRIRLYRAAPALLAALKDEMSQSIHKKGIEPTQPTFAERNLWHRSIEAIRIAEPEYNRETEE